MANRRMFSMKIVDTDAFLDMPQSSQLLYYSLAMRADDDGFVSNPKKVMRMMGSNEDDYKVLVVKKFIIPFESGVCVIKHWLIHNLIRGDRYTETQWLKEKSQLIIDDKTKKYSLNKGQNDVIPLGNQVLPQVRLGKVRLGKVSIAETSSAEIPLLIKAFEEVDPKNKTYYGNTTQRKACSFLIGEYGLDKVLEFVRVLPEINAMNLYVAQVTTPDELMKNWVKLENVYKKQKNKPKNYVL